MWGIVSYWEHLKVYEIVFLLLFKSLNHFLFRCFVCWIMKKSSFMYLRVLLTHITDNLLLFSLPFLSHNSSAQALLSIFRGTFLKYWLWKFNRHIKILRIKSNALFCHSKPHNMILLYLAKLFPNLNIQVFLLPPQCLDYHKMHMIFLVTSLE